MNSSYTIIKYAPEHREMWDDFIAFAKNTTFLHKRSFMEYHNDRFTDHSIIIKKDTSIVAVLPANVANTQIFSHQGLTYGGLLLSPKLKLTETISVFQQLLEYLNHLGFKNLLLRQIPSFYSKYPSEEIDYLAHLTKAETYRIDTTAVIDQNNKLSIQSNRMEGVKKAKKKGLAIKEDGAFDNFWNTILEPNLKDRHHARPTHSVEEIKLLASRFPENIKQFNVYDVHQLVGGATIFETETTAHVQYISADTNKQELGTLDFLFHGLIQDTFSRKRYFDFGISNENHGQHLNKGLSYWKECFGARTFVHRFYNIETKNHTLLNDVLI